METTPLETVPTLSLLINLLDAKGQESAQIVASQLRSLGVPATWIIDQPQQAINLRIGQLATIAHEFALVANARTPQSLRSEISSQQNELVADTGKSVSVVVGNSEQLRARAAVLADQGINTIIDNAGDITKPPRLLPCNIWQLAPSASLPGQRRLLSLLPARRLTTSQLAAASSSQPAILAINLAQLPARGLQSCAQLLREIAEADRQQELVVKTIGQLATELTIKNEMKPQRSILRQAA